MKFEERYISKVKLIIWDLDDTFWKGTLSESMEGSGIKYSVENCNLVRRLSERGIINSICSKNDKDIAEKELERLGMKEYFVFNSINWDAKGGRIKNIIKAMNLRAENVLFVDDNLTNLAEAEYVNEGLMTSLPEGISLLVKNIDSIGKEDGSLSRLNQYKVLEKKYQDSKDFSTNVDFLRNSGIKICIRQDVVNELERIYELIQRTNQLNFTKKRISLEELTELANNKMYKTGYVIAEDKYGKYGIVGFFAIQHNKLEHFLFSCRTMGMGVEQYVYVYLGKPELEIVGSVSAVITKENDGPDYIQLVDDLENDSKENAVKKSELSILFKGPCDLQVMTSYIEGLGQQMDKEFNFIDSKGNQADFYNHTVNILNSKYLGGEKIKELTSKFSFLSSESFQTSMFGKKYDVICISPLMDATLAVYKSKKENFLFPYGLYCKPINDKAYWNEYIEKKVMTARSNFLKYELEDFSEEFDLVEYTPKMIVDNIEKIITEIRKIDVNTYVVILLLAELRYDGKKDDFAGKEKIHKSINQEIKNRFSNDENVYLLDVNRYIKSQGDYFDNINHYSKLVYYNMAKEFVDVVKKEKSLEMGTKFKFKAFYENLKRKLYKNIFLKCI